MWPRQRRSWPAVDASWCMRRSRNLRPTRRPGFGADPEDDLILQFRVSRMFARIRQVKPRRLYIAAEGPRSTVQTDTEKCQSVQQVVLSIDWDCCVSSNLNCGV